MPDGRTVKTLERARLFNLITYALLLIFLIPGCGGKGAGDVTAPATDKSPSTDGPPALTAAIDYPPSVPGQIGGKASWGLWDIALDRESGFQVVPLRGVEYFLNVNTFLQPPMGSLANLQINVVNMEKLFIAGDVTVDVSITHPFPAASQFTGFDVLGVIIGKGTFVANSDIGIIFADPHKNPVLKNADGYTRWMNQLEFTTEGLRGYTEGARGKKDQFWNSSLNGYKYFATNLYPTESIVEFYQSSSIVSQRGMFSTNATNTRRYDLRFPMVGGFPDVRFQYAVVASWVEPVNIPPLNLPGDFPAAANMQEAFHCEISTVGSSLYWNNMYDNGGDLFLTLEIFDWQGMTNLSGVAGEIKQVILDSPDEFINNGTKMVFDSNNWTMLDGTCANSVRLALDVGQVQPGGPCPYDNDVLITIVTAEEGSYDNGLGGAYPITGVLSGYARLFYDMGNICNDPPILTFLNCPTSSISVANRTFMWEGQDDVTPNNQLQYRYKVDSDPWTDWETGLKQAYLENLTQDTHTIWVECRDMDGQVSQAQCTFLVELPPEPQPPSVEFIDCGQYIRSSTYTFHLDLSDDNTSISHLKVRYSFEGGPWINLPDGSTSITLNGLVAGGPYQLMVEVEDLDGMIDQALCEFNVNLKPSVAIINCPPFDINNDFYTFNWTGADPEMDPLEYQTQLDATGWSAWGGATSQALSGLPSGNHTFYVRVRDTTGGTDQVQCNFKVNLYPTITITNKPTQDVNATSYDFTWTSSDDLDSPLTMQYNVELDGVWQGWQLGINHYDWNPVGPGGHSIRVRVRDSGNPQLWVEDLCNFIVNTKPSVSIDNCPIGYWGGTSITLDWTGTDDNSPEAGMSYSWKMDTDPWSAWQLGQLSANYVGLNNGNHTFSVRVRDTGNPILACDTPPDTCDVCDFAIDTSCAVPPGSVTMFKASDGDMILGDREVKLDWNMNLGCVDTYDIERLDYNWGSGAWEWVPVQSVVHPTISWTDTNARYSGSANSIMYRIRATNVSGSSPVWSMDSGHPKMRNVHMALWCLADDASGTNSVVTWPRGAADSFDNNDFWNDYGFNFVLQNSGDFFYVPEPGLKNPVNMAQTNWVHTNYGQATFSNSLNIYYYNSWNGNTGAGWCTVFCPGASHNVRNVYILLTRDVRGTPPNEVPIVLAHECGHALARLWDEYLLDTNRNLILDDGTSCAANDTWCMSPWLFCDDNAAYPENPGASGKVPKDLMWYSFATPVIQYNLYPTQGVWSGEWVHGYEANYPWP